MKNTEIGKEIIRIIEKVKKQDLEIGLYLEANIIFDEDTEVVSYRGERTEEILSNILPED